jgi:hypothetical protein
MRRYMLGHGRAIDVIASEELRMMPYTAGDRSKVKRGANRRARRAVRQIVASHILWER